MEAWADMRGHLPARENTGGPAVDGHLISTDPVALPVLILLFGQEYVEGDGDAPSQHWYDNITSAAGAVGRGDTTIFQKGADLFDAVILPRLDDASKQAVQAVHGFSSDYKARAIGAVIRDMAGRPGAFTPSLHLVSDWPSLAPEHRVNAAGDPYIPFPLTTEQCSRGPGTLTLVSALMPLITSPQFRSSLAALTGLRVADSGASPGPGLLTSPVAHSLTIDARSIEQLTTASSEQAAVHRQAMNSTPAAQTEVRKMKRTDPYVLDAALDDPAQQAELNSQHATIAAISDAKSRSEQLARTATSILTKADGSDPNVKAVAGAIYIGNSMGAKASHDKYVTLLNQASAALSLSISTHITSKIPFGHKFHDSVGEMVAELKLMRKTFFDKDRHLIALGYNAASGTMHSINTIHDVRIVTEFIDAIMTKLGWNFTGVAKQLNDTVLEIQTDHKVEDISVIFHTLVTKFYKLFCMAVSDKVGGYFHSPKPKPDPNDLLTYKTRDSLRAKESSFDPYMFQLAGEMVSARLELQQIGRRNETSNTSRIEEEIKNLRSQADRQQRVLNSMETTWSDVGRGNQRGSRGDHGRGNGRDRGGNSDRDRDSDRDSGRQRDQNRDQEERKVSFRDDVDTPNRRRNGRPRSLPGGIPIEAADEFFRERNGCCLYDDLGQLYPAWRRLCKSSDNRGPCVDSRNNKFLHVGDKRKDGARVNRVSLDFLRRWADRFAIPSEPAGAGHRALQTPELPDAQRQHQPHPNAKRTLLLTDRGDDGSNPVPTPGSQRRRLSHADGS
jgi:hypothetical protein